MLTPGYRAKIKNELAPGCLGQKSVFIQKPPECLTKKYIYTKFTSAWREKSPESLSTFRAFIIFLDCDVCYLKLKHHTNVQTVNHCTWRTINLYSAITIFAHAIDSMAIEQRCIATDVVAKYSTHIPCKLGSLFA